MLYQNVHGSNVKCLIYCRVIYSWVNVSGVVLNISACTEQSNYLHMHGAQLEQVKGRHEVLSTRSRSTLTNTWAGFQFSYEGASLQAS